MAHKALAVELPGYSGGRLLIKGALRVTTGEAIQDLRIHVQLRPRDGRVTPVTERPQTELQVIEATDTPVPIHDRLIKTLGLEDATLLFLWSIGVKTIGDLVARSERQLQTELHKAITGNKAGRKVQARAEAVSTEVAKKLEPHGLRFADIEGRARRSLILDPVVTHFPPTDPIDDTFARDILGDQFDLFWQLRNGRTIEEKVAARNAIVAANTRLTWKEAHRIFPYLSKTLDDPALEVDDFAQEGFIGQILGTEKFDYPRGYRYSTYVTWWIKQAINRFAADTTILPVHVIELGRRIAARTATLLLELGREPTREEVASAVGITVEKIEKNLVAMQYQRNASSLNEAMTNGNGDEGRELLELVADPSPGPDELIDLKLMKEAVDRILTEAPIDDADRKCVILYFGLRGYRPHTDDEIGGYLGVTRQRVQQRLERALRRLWIPEVWAIAHEHVRTLQPPSALDPRFVLEVNARLDDLTIRWQPKSDVAKGILEAVAAEHTLSADDLKGVKTDDRLARIQQDAVARMKDRSGVTFVTIGEILGVQTEDAFHAYVTGKELPRAIPVLSEIGIPHGVSARQLRAGVFIPENLIPLRRMAIRRLRDELKLGFSAITFILDLPDAREVKLQYAMAKTEQALFVEEKP